MILQHLANKLWHPMTEVMAAIAGMLCRRSGVMGGIIASTWVMVTQYDKCAVCVVYWWAVKVHSCLCCGHLSVLHLMCICSITGIKWLEQRPGELEQEEVDSLSQQKFHTGCLGLDTSSCPFIESDDRSCYW